MSIKPVHTLVLKWRKNLLIKIEKLKKALITGIAGQDGSYLAEYLLSLNYKVHGIVRRNSTPEHQSSRLNPNLKNLETHYGDLSDISS